MKKSLLSLGFLLGICTSAFCEINWFTPQPEHIFQANVVFETKNSFLPYRAGFQALYELDMRELDARAGLNFGKDAFDLFVSGKYMPTFNNSFSAGVFLNYHLFSYYNSFCDNDFLIGASFEARTPRIFTFDFDFGYYFKGSTIYSLPDANKNVASNSMALAFNFDWKVAEAVHVYARAASYEDFYHMLFLVPSYTAGCLVQLPNKAEHFTVGGEITVRYTDFFTLSGHFDGLEVKLIGKYKL